MIAPKWQTLIVGSAIQSLGFNIRYWPLPDMRSCPANVRFWQWSGPGDGAAKCPLM